MPDFLDKIVGGINKGVATVGANSKAMMEKSKVNSTINSIENERTQLLQMLGQKIYDSYTESGTIPMDSVESFCAQINQRLELITRQKEELRRIEEEANRAIQSASQPPQVGHGYPSYTSVPPQGVDPYSRPPQPPPPPSGAKPCDCGHYNTETAKFCALCGKPQ